MSTGWTPERKAKQAEAIKKWQPWASAVGPKTSAGKKISARNAWKGGHRPHERAIMKELNDMMKVGQQVLEALVPKSVCNKPGITWWKGRWK